jgi:nicotinate-nucleotide--dimethylbenzimidazole phosphoribosyltransferase
MADDGEALLRGIAARRSVRRFTDAPVDEALLERVLAAAHAAPSAGNRQAWTFTVVTDPGLRRALGEAVTAAWQTLLAGVDSTAVREAMAGYLGNLDWFPRAPVLIAVTARTPETFLVEALGPSAGAVSGNACSAAMAAENLLLAAAAVGLGACPLTGAVAAAARLRPLLGLGQRQDLVCLVALGHPAERPSPPLRKDLAAVVRRMP